jgi:hypothetical protein
MINRPASVQGIQQEVNKKLARISRSQQEFQQRTPTKNIKRFHASS